MNNLLYWIVIVLGAMSMAGTIGIGVAGVRYNIHWCCKRRGQSDFWDYIFGMLGCWVGCCVVTAVEAVVFNMFAGWVS